MAISIKNKIRSGTLFLFFLLIVSGGVSIYFLLLLQNDAKNIIRANYESLDYSHQMQQQLDNPSAVDYTILDSLLKKQELNVTERGEQEETALLRYALQKLSKADSTEYWKVTMRNHIQSVIALNMNAIQRKNLQAQKTSAAASNVIALISVLIFIMGLVFTINFPSIVVTPINKFKEAIKEISKRNYAHKIHLDTNDEFKELGNAFNDMSERLEEFESSNLNKLIFEKTRAEAVINSLRDASIGIEKDGKILFANEQALGLLGLSAADVLGKSTEEVSTKNDLFNFLITKEGSAPFKIVIDEKENYYIKEVMNVAQGTTDSRVIVLKNITSFKELDAAKTNFIATVSHELKTPLASSDLSLKLLEDKRVSILTEEQAELVTQLKNDNRRMLKILSELLNLGQVEAGKIQLQIAPVNLNSIIDNSLDVVSNAAKERNIKINSNPEPLPDVNADADKISWVLNNFLTNAIKFSPENSIIIVSSYTKNGRVSIEVKDEGPGIDKVFYDRIFERYFQIPGRSDKKGSGIGLAICKELVTAMGGTIRVSGGPAEGSTFGFDLPV